MSTEESVIFVLSSISYSSVKRDLWWQHCSFISRAVVESKNNFCSQKSLFFEIKVFTAAKIVITNTHHTRTKSY